MSEVPQIKALAAAAGGPGRLVGREIGPIAVQEREFPNGLDFSGASFVGPVEFKRCDFRDDVRFARAEFMHGATFFDCTFGGWTDFSWTTFRGPAYFWRAHFNGRATFESCVVQAPEAALRGFVEAGETNFSWAVFREEVCFLRSYFLDSAFFWRTVFRQRVTFDQARFGRQAVFEGTAHKVSVSERDFATPGLFERMRARGVLSPDPETKPPVYWNFGEATPQALQACVADAGIDETGCDEVLRIWHSFAHEMFVEGVLTGMTFAIPDRVEFLHVNLGECTLAGTDLEGVVLEGIKWTHRPQRPAGRRIAVRDELKITTPAELAAVGTLYNRLRRNADRRDRSEDAAQFYFGELEMRRMSAAAPFRNVSLLAFYKYLSGY